MEIEACVRCGRELKTAKTFNQTADPGVAIYLSAVTMGIRPRLRTRYQRGLFCPCCTISVSYGPAPEGEFNLKVHRMLVEMIELDKDRSIIESGRILLFNPDARPRLMPGSKPDETLSSPILAHPALAS
jgi:hypothetical protein